MTEQKERPLGKLFTEVYRDRGAQAEDSEKFRVQLAAILDNILGRAQRDRTLFAVTSK